MTLTPGTRLGVYEITAQIGVGGMGEVWRARDTDLGRQVAIKVLPDAFAHDADRLVRFEREAKTLAALNHPNIASIYGLEKADGIRALVMELVNGQTLADRIAMGAMHLSDALPIASQIAEALEAAHDKGIVHRDLKPSNVKITPDGIVKVLDFGLAKAMAPDGSTATSDLGNSPTLTSPATQLGMILGTASYMSPEQAQGRTVDRRTDIWAFGVALFEMLSGKRLFDGETVTEKIAAVIKDPMRLERLPAETPPALRKLIERCLERDSKLRLRDIGEARIALQGRDVVAPVSTTSHSAGPRTAVLGAMAAGVVVLAAAAGWFLGSRTASPAANDATPFAAQFVPTPVDAFAFGATVRLLNFGPDGALIYATSLRSGRMLYRKDRASKTGVPIPGTEGAYGPFLSPDGSAIGFFADGKIKHIPVAGGVAQVVHDLKDSAAKDAQALGWYSEVGLGSETGYGATWLPDNTIVYGRMVGGLWRVPVSGGAPTPVTKDLPEGEFAHRLPHALPGGKSILMTVVRGVLANVGSTIELLDLPTGSRRLVMSDATDGRYARGHLLFAREGALFAVAFNPASAATSGAPIRIVDDVMHAIGGYAPGGASAVAQYAVADDGTLAVLGGGMLPPPPNQIASITPGGKIERWPGGPYMAPRFSPDGTRLAVVGAGGTSLIDSRSHLATELVRNLIFPVWKADGTGVIAADNSANQALSEVSLEGTVSRNRIATSKHLLWPSSVSRDGKWLAYVETNPVTGNDVWVASVKGEAPPVVVANTPASETHPAFSPDGKWIVYAIADSGSPALYVRAFPGSGRAEKISPSGIAPIWADDGRSLFFARRVPSQVGEAELLRASVEVNGDRFRLGREQVIATGPMGWGSPVGGFDVWRDGRIVVGIWAPPPAPAAPPAPPTLTVIFDAIR